MKPTPLRLPAVACGFALALLSAACDETGMAAPDAGQVDFTIGTLPFHLSSGAWWTCGTELSLFVSDNTDTCLAISNQVANLPVTRLRLDISPPLDGTTVATVVPQPIPAVGQASGNLNKSLLGTVQTTISASDGSVSWTASTDGSGTYVINALDVGFTGATGRVTTGGLLLQPCTCP
jgi:hypothetical protein